MGPTDWMRRLLGRPPQPEEPVAQTEPSEPADASVRMHLAANDPGFPARREAGFALILEAVGAVAARQGYEAKTRSWVKQGPLGTASVQVQRSRYGFDCTVLLGFDPLDGQRHGIWADEDVLTLADFPDADGTEAACPATLIYLDALENPASLDRQMRTLEFSALRWMETQIGTGAS